MTALNHIQHIQPIQAPRSHPALRARQRLRDRGGELLAELAAHVELATGLQLPLADRERARDRLITFCTRRVVRHLLAVDEALYGVAAAATETRLLVRALRGQHDLVAARITQLRRADSSAELAAAAHALAELVGVCHVIEQDVLIPALALQPGVELAALVDDVDVLLAGEALDTPAMPAPSGVLDIRAIPLSRRCPRIFASYARLAPGESFVVVDDHDPLRLRRALESAEAGPFGWDYLEQGPDRWRIRVTRPAVSE